MGLETNGNENSENQFDDEFWRKWEKILLESNLTDMSTELQALYAEYGNPFQKYLDLNATVDMEKWFTMVQDREALISYIGDDEDVTISEIVLGDPPVTDGYIKLKFSVENFPWGLFKTFCPNANGIRISSTEIPLNPEGLTPEIIAELGDTEHIVVVAFCYDDVLKLEKPAK